MVVYYLLIFYIFFVSIINHIYKSFKLDKYYIFSVFVAFLLVSALRDPYFVGKDIPSYLTTYYQSTIYDWNTLLLENRFEPGYLAYNKILNDFNFSEYSFIAVTSFLILLGPYYVISKYSKMPFLSWYIYIALGFFAFGMSGIRNALAISIIFLGFKFLLNKNYLIYIFLILLSISIHKVGIFFLLALPFLIYINPVYKNSWIYFSVLLFVILSKSYLGFLFGSLESLENYSSYLVESNTYNYLLFMLSFFLLAFYLYNKQEVKTFKSQLLINMVFFGVVYQIFGSVSSNATRVSELMFIYIILLVPEMINMIKEVNLKIIFTVMLVLIFMVIYVFLLSGGGYGVVPYKTFA